MATRLSEYFLRRRLLLWVILLVNLLSSFYGYYWYRWQLAATPWYLWLFTPDCPLAATMMAVALGLYLLAGRRQSWYHLLTYTTLIKYGFWTVTVFGLYWLTGGRNYSLDYLMLFISHIGMLLEGVIFLGSMRGTPGQWWFAALYSLAFDYFDYFHPIRLSFRRATGVYPALPNDAHRPGILLMTLGITAVFLAVAIVVTIRQKKGLRPRGA